MILKNGKLELKEIMLNQSLDQDLTDSFRPRSAKPTSSCRRPWAIWLAYICGLLGCLLVGFTGPLVMAQEQPSQVEVDAAKARYEKAYSHYTRLVTTGGAGDVQLAQAEYKAAFLEYETIKAKAVVPMLTPNQTGKAAKDATRKLDTGDAKGALDALPNKSNTSGQVAVSPPPTTGLPAPPADVIEARIPLKAAGMAMDHSHLSVAVFSPADPPDELEEEMGQLLGRLSWINYIIQPEDMAQLIVQIRMHNASKRKFDCLVFAGHGSADTPHVKLKGVAGDTVEGGIMPPDVDIAYWRDFYTKQLERLKKNLSFREKLKLKQNRTPDDDVALAKAEGNVAQLIKENAASKIVVDHLESTADVMNENARVLMLNCSPAATPEGQRFVMNLGRMFMGKRGGTIAAPSSDFSTFEVRNKAVEWLSGSEIGDVAFSASWRVFDIPATPVLQAEDGVAPVLDLHFDPAVLEARPGDSLWISPVVEAMSDSGKLSFWWNGSASSSEFSSAKVDIPADASGEISVPVIVQDERGRQGHHTLVIKLPEFTKLQELATFKQCGQLDGAPERTCTQYEFVRHGTTCLVDGVARVTTEHGQPLCEVSYHGGVLDGLHRTFHEGGRVGIEGAYANGKRTGPWKGTNAGGQLEYDMDFVSGEVHGRFRWYRDGKLEREGMCENGRARGQWREWRDGNLIEEQDVSATNSVIRTIEDGRVTGTRTKSGDLGCATPQTGVGLCEGLFFVPPNCTPRFFNQP